jgi:hypothetical protein
MDHFKYWREINDFGGSVHTGFPILASSLRMIRIPKQNQRS